MKEYLKPYFEVSEFELEDIMTSTGGMTNGGNSNDLEENGNWTPLGEEIDVLG